MTKVQALPKITARWHLLSSLGRNLPLPGQSEAFTDIGAASYMKRAESHSKSRKKSSLGPSIPSHDPSRAILSLIREQIFLIFIFHVRVRVLQDHGKNPSGAAMPTSFSLLVHPPQQILRANCRVSSFRKKT
jgi:hypothetical protein